ncbi:hypothetical protein NQ318_015058 [Aromia moschata]|uniref:Uncharacterized protein n=1 Tax=Aromia moschata TaxID=1265417 RepID=A0AAV8YZW1_9CUCU|nr:hypothetical protein NQ318_015058 [Aromia moschata]
MMSLASDMMGENDDDNSELSEQPRFLTKGVHPRWCALSDSERGAASRRNINATAGMPEGPEAGRRIATDNSKIFRFIPGAFLLTPSHDLTLDKAANICDKLNFRGSFSLTKTATGILFKFSEPEDYLQVFRKGFHKVTGGRLYRKVQIPCRPQKTYSLLVQEVPHDLPEDDIRASLYRYGSVVEVTRLPNRPDQQPGTAPPIRVTVASLDEYNSLLQQGLDFYGATYFPTEPLKKEQLRGSREKLLPVFDAAGFSRIPAPPTRTLRPLRA